MLYRRFITSILMLSLALLLTSCLEVKQGITINKDGSGEARLEVAVQKEWASQLIPKLKGDMPKGWNVVEEKAKEGKHVVIFNRKFKDISELNDNETRYTFSSERKGFLKKSYVLEVKQLKSSDMPFPYEVTIKMPGSIDETDGIKIASGEVKWNLQGLRRGTNLSVKSSTFALPDFLSVKDSLSQFITSLLYQEAIVFSSSDNAINIMDATGGNQKKLLVNGWGASWSSATQKIAFFSNRDGNEEIYLTDINGHNTKRLTTHPAADWAPSLSPDGSRIAFLSQRDGADEIYVMDADGTNVKRLTNTPCRKFSPSWSPDGKKIAFHSCDDTYYTGRYHAAIYVMNADGGNVRMLPNNHANSERPFWSPDGENIAFSSDRNGSYKIYIMDENGGNIKRLTGSSDDHRPLWSPDGKKIAFLSYHGGNIDISVTNADGSSSKILSKFPTEDGDLDAWILLPRITFISPGLARIIILVTITLTGVLLLFGMALVARKAVNAIDTVIPKGKPISKGIFCPQCGKENSPSAAFCVNCGQKMH